MKSAVKLLTLSSLFVFAMNASAFAFSVSYDQKVSLGENIIASIKVYVQDEKMSAQSSFNGMTSVVLRNETGTYSYLPEQKMATKIPASMDRPNLTRDLPRFMEFLKQNQGKKTGSETLAGKACDIYLFTEPTLKLEAKAWVWTEKNFPVKIEVPSPEGLTIVELENIQFDPVIPASQFQIPEDVKVLDLEETKAIDLSAQTKKPTSPANAKSPFEKEK